MEDALIAILETFKYPVDRQGSMSSYPETFITFWCNDSPDHAHYDNEEYGATYDYNVYIYSSNAATAYSLTDDIRAALKAAGWIVPSRGFDVDSDEEAHIGRGLNCMYLNV